MTDPTARQRGADYFRRAPSWAALAAAREYRRASVALDGSTDDIAAWHRARPADALPALTDRVWSDLEMDGVFRLIDRCGSATGQQVLYDVLRRPLFDADEISARDRLVRALAADDALRAAIAVAVRGLRTGATYDLHNLITDHLPERPAWYPILPALSVAAAISIGVMFVAPLTGVLMLVATVSCNIGIQIFYRPGVHHLIRPISALPGLLEAARQLSRVTTPAVAPHAAALRDLCARLRWLGSPARYAVQDSDGTSVVAMLIGYINLVFLADVNAFVFSIELIRRHRDDIATLIHTVGMLDALCAVAAFRHALPHWSSPELDAAPKTLTARGIYHPLVTEPVGNGLHLDGTSMLITGSNMAGKTTYLRAAAVCAVLGQTIATCTARSWRSACMRVETLISRSDDLLTGRSYFLVEAEHVRDLLDAAGGDAPHLFVLDELYRGTNTHERVPAAHGVLERLNRGPHLCLVATHDVELTGLLTGGWEPWHFQETWGADGMQFDYLIRAGEASAGNALKVLDMVGYPPDVMATARATFERLRQRTGGP